MMSNYIKFELFLTISMQFITVPQYVVNLSKPMVLNNLRELTEEKVLNFTQN